MLDKTRPRLTSTKELRKFLLDQMSGVIEGRVSAEQTKSITNLAQQVYNTLNVEIKIAVARSKLTEPNGIKPVNFDD